MLIIFLHVKSGCVLTHPFFITSGLVNNDYGEGNDGGTDRRMGCHGNGGVELELKRQVEQEKSQSRRK